MHLGDQPLRERVHDRDADPVQAARDLVALAAELAAGVQLRQHDRQRRQPCSSTSTGMPRPFVDDGDRVVGWIVDLDGRCTRERLVDGVVDDLVDEVMEAA
jgi:hypothetical protein